MVTSSFFGSCRSLRWITWGKNKQSNIPTLVSKTGQVLTKFSWVFGRMLLCSFWTGYVCLHPNSLTSLSAISSHRGVDSFILWSHLRIHSTFTSTKHVCFQLLYLTWCYEENTQTQFSLNNFIFSHWGHELCVWSAKKCQYVLIKDWNKHKTGSSQTTSLFAKT